MKTLNPFEVSPTEQDKTNEPTEVVNNIDPLHYTRMAISPHKYNKANNMPWNEAQVIRYISRWRAKNGKEDLLKCLWYLNDLIDGLEDEGL